MGSVLSSVLRRAIFDNMKTAVDRIGTGKVRSTRSGNRPIGNVRERKAGGAGNWNPVCRSGDRRVPLVPMAVLERVECRETGFGGQPPATSR